jgi:hypothetical protein
MTEKATKPTIEYLDRLPPGWFIVDVLPETENTRCRNWAALLVDVDPDDLKTSECDFLARFYVDPDDYQPGSRKTHQGWFRFPGKYKNRDLAWDALQEMMVTRH